MGAFQGKTFADYFASLVLEQVNGMTGVMPEQTKDLPRPMFEIAIR